MPPENLQAPSVPVTEPFVTLRYFGPGVHTDLPAVGDHLKRG